MLLVVCCGALVVACWRFGRCSLLGLCYQLFIVLPFCFVGYCLFRFTCWQLFVCLRLLFVGFCFLFIVCFVGVCRLLFVVCRS